jgi:hypothetical protein
VAKLFKTDDSILDVIESEWGETSLCTLGIVLKIISTNKSKQIIKLSKASKTVEYLLREEDLLTMTVYEDAWNKLSPLDQRLLLKGAFSIISYDSERERLNMDNRPYQDLFNMRHMKDANGNEFLDKYDNALERASLIIESIEEEERKKKEEEKEAKRMAREAKKALKNKN